MTPEVVVFDLGKVLLDFDYSIAARKLAAEARIPEAATQTSLASSSLLIAYETGQLSTAEFLRQSMDALDYTGHPESFADAFSDIFSPIPELVEANAELRRRGVSTFIFSNTNPLAIGHIRRRFPFFREFDGYVLSYEEGAMKPDALIYKAVERVTRKQTAAILYIDDRPENIEAGRARGWQVILQEDPARTRSEIDRAFLLG
jgi:HAD superfamily hydrolase (TIGR01509 family)